MAYSEIALVLVCAHRCSPFSAPDNDVAALADLWRTSPFRREAQRRARPSAPSNSVLYARQARIVPLLARAQPQACLSMKPLVGHRANEASRPNECNSAPQRRTAAPFNGR
jgi:hypothetical protein